MLLAMLLLCFCDVTSRTCHALCHISATSITHTALCIGYFDSNDPADAIAVSRIAAITNVVCLCIDPGRTEKYM